MALRFRKRLRLAKGVHLNLSNKGVSTTLGHGPLSVNIGKAGKARMTASLPGSGLSYTHQLGGTAPAGSSTLMTQQPTTAAPDSNPGPSAVGRVLILTAVLAGFAIIVVVGISLFR
jgi:hypothetical protein